MKEIELSLLFIDVSRHVMQQAQNLVGDEILEKKWDDQVCIEYFDDSDSEDELPKRVDAFIKRQNTKLLLGLEGKKIIRIGVFFDTANCNIYLEPPTVFLIREHGLGVMISCYPSSEDE